MPSRLGSLVSDRRKTKGLSLRQFARLIGKSPTFVSMLENDDHAPAVKEQTLADIARELSLDLDELLGLVGKMPEAALPESRLDVVLYRRLKRLSDTAKKELLENLEQRD